MTDVPLMNNPMTTAGDIIQGGASGAPTRLALGTAGQVPTVNAGATALEYQTPATGSTGEELDYGEKTTTTTIVATTSAGATTIVTGSSVAYDGSTEVWVEFFSPQVQTPAATSGFVAFGLFEDGTSIGNIAVVLSQLSTAHIRVPVLGKRKITPSNASHTYSIRAWRDGGADTADVAAGAGGANTLVPAYIRITRA